MNEQAVEHHEKLQVMLEAIQNKKKADEEREALVTDVQDNSSDNDEEEPNLVGEEIRTDIVDLLIPKPDEATLETRIGMLNVDQHRVFDRVTQSLEHHLLYDQGQCTCSELKPFSKWRGGNRKIIFD